MKNRCFCSWHQSPDNAKSPKKNVQIFFLDIQTHPHLLPITTGFISSIKVSMKIFLVMKNFRMVINVGFVPCIGILTFRYSK